MRRRFSQALASAALIVAGMATTVAAETKIERVISPGGVEAWLVEERAIPIISIQIGFRGGASRDPAEKVGRASMFAGLMSEGAGEYDARAFAARTEELAARLSFSANSDVLRASATMLLEKRDETLALFKLALHEPRFDEAPIERVRAQMLSAVKQAETNPDTLASRAWYKAMFPTDAYGRPSGGTTESVTGLTAADLREARTALLNRNEMKIGVVGAISAEELGPILDDLLAGLPDATLSALPKAEPASPAGVEVVDLDAPQSTVTFGHLGLPRDDPDFIPAYVMNYVLGGGGFASRLMVEIREKRGLAYGVYSYIAPFDRAAVYLGGVATSNERVAESIDLVRQEWRRMVEEGMTEEDLEKAKRYLTGSFALRFDSNVKIANFLVSSQLDDLPIDYITTRNQLVDAVTLEDIQRAAARVLAPESLYFVVVGRPEGVETSIR